MDPVHSLSHKMLSEILAFAPIPVQQAMVGELNQGDIIRLVTTLDDEAALILARGLARILDVKALGALVMNVLRMEEKKSYPFLARVISCMPDVSALSLANLVMNNGTHEQMDTILGDDALSQERMCRLINNDKVRDKVVAVTSELWDLEQAYHADPTKDEATRLQMLNHEPVLDEYVSLCSEPQDGREERWLKSEHRLMFNNNNDIAHVREDWPKQRAWYEGLLGKIDDARNKEGLKAISISMRKQLRAMSTYQSKGIRFAFPALTNYDLDRIDEFVANSKFSKAQKGTRDVLEAIIRRHDDFQLFPQSELLAAENDSQIIALTAPELYTLSISCDKVEKEAAQTRGNKDSALRLLGDIDLYLFRTKQLLRLTSKHLQHILFMRHAGLFTIHTLNHLDYCPKLQMKVEATIAKEFLKEDGKSLLSHYRGLRSATRALELRFEKLKLQLAP